LRKLFTVINLPAKSDMKNYSAQELKDSLECYNPECELFPILANSDKKLSARDVLLILRWKLGRIKYEERHADYKIVSQKNLNKINRAIETARRQGDELDALNELIDIRGIGLSVATAILTICCPEKYTIIDWRALETLDLFPSEEKRQKRKDEQGAKKYITEDWTPQDYCYKFIKAVMVFKKENNCSTLRDADRKLWGLSVNEQIKHAVNKAAEISE